MSIPMKALPEHGEMVDNILTVFEDATPEDVAEGLEWYSQALRLAQNLSAGTAYTTEQCAGVIAAISPRLSWSKNTVYPAHILRYHQQGEREVKSWRDGDKGMSVQFNNRERALKILDGENPENLLGLKCMNFYMNILGDDDAVTVDSWATKVALLDPDVNDNPGPAAYQKVADAYREAAAHVGISPRSLQAATWCSYRKLYGYGKVK